MHRHPEWRRFTCHVHGWRHLSTRWWLCAEHTTNNPLEINLDAHGAITGVCQFWYNGVHYPQYDESRTISYLYIGYTPPGCATSYSPRYPVQFVVTQDFDTRNPNGGNGSIPINPIAVGTHEESVQTFTTSTNCGMQTSSAIVTRTFNVLSCKPNWFTGGTPTVNFHAPPSGAIKIRIPSIDFEHARVPAQQAAADWAASLGRTVTVESGYGTCSASDPLCVGFKNDHGTRPGDTGCASLDTASYNATTGAWEGSTAVRFEPN
jgi:hypothetical protein